MPTVLELFAGCGGLALGLENAGLTPSMLVEIDKDAVATLERNRSDWQVLQTDVSKLSFTGIKADIVAGGFPCQPFSKSGKRLGFNDPLNGTLFYEFVRCVNMVQPKIFLAENVKGIISHDNGKTLTTILSAFKSLGYNVQCHLLNALDYEVPQKRERLFIVGIRADFDGGFQYPKPIKNRLTLRDALKDVPQSAGISYPAKRAEVMKLVPPGGCWRDLPSDVKKDYMKKCSLSGGGQTGIARRMSWDEPSLTLLTLPTQKTTDRCHPDETRPFTVREYARIQTFPDDWVFMGSLKSQYKQIGNAVPVNLAYHLGLSIMDALQS